MSFDNDWQSIIDEQRLHAIAKGIMSLVSPLFSSLYSVALNRVPSYLVISFCEILLSLKGGGVTDWPFFSLSSYSLLSFLYLQARLTGPQGPVDTSEDRQPTEDWRPRRGYWLSSMTQRKGGPPDSKWREDGCQWLQLSALMLPTHRGKRTATADFYRYVFHQRSAACKFICSICNEAKNEVHPNS